MNAFATSPTRLSRPAALHLQVWLFLGLFAGLVLFNQAAEAAPAEARCTTLVASGNPQYPPYLWRDPADENRLIGANADLMQLLAQELGVAIELRYVGPWGRVQEEAKAGRIDLIAGAFWTQARTEYMDYFTPAFHQTRSVIWVGAKSRLNYSRWSDLIGQQGVTVINNSFGEAFDRYAKQSLKISQVASLEQAIQMLQRGRASYLIYEDSPGQAFLAKLDINNVKMLSPAVANENLHLTLSHKSPCNTGELRGRIARAMHKLGGASVLPDLLEKNIQLWRQQSQLVK